MDPRPALAVLVATLLLGSTAFAADVTGGRQYEPVAFDDTIELGLTGAVTVRANDGSFVVPKAEAFYSGYRYVVGYNGVETLFAEHVADPTAGLTVRTHGDAGADVTGSTGSDGSEASGDTGGGGDGRVDTGGDGDGPIGGGDGP